MRIASLLFILVCSLTVSAAPEMSVVTEPADTFVASAADEAEYQALQEQADRARDMLAQSQGQRIALAQLAAD